jgi:hypothetical protein
MNMPRIFFSRIQSRLTSHAELAAALLSAAVTPLYSQNSQETTAVEARPLTSDSKFFCNSKVLDPTEREHHQQLTDKLISTRTQIVESDKGYEFQFRPSDISLAELSGWVFAEAKCCPFFDFHIDLENEGTLLCLRLTGKPGIKAFIQSEFHVPAK